MLSLIFAWPICIRDHLEMALFLANNCFDKRTVKQYLICLLQHILISARVCNIILMSLNYQTYHINAKFVPNLVSLQLFSEEQFIQNHRFVGLYKVPKLLAAQRGFLSFPFYYECYMYKINAANFSRNSMEVEH